MLSRTRRERRINFLFMLNITSIGKTLGGKRIVSNLSLFVGSGEVIGITGPVGAGKSTLFHIATGLLDPDSGTVSFFGSPFNETNRPIIAKQINYASSNQRLSGYATGWENLATYADLYDVPDWQSRVSALWRDLKMPSALLEKKVYRLSSGENSFVNLSKALLNNPKILFLDEITAHMDPALADRVRTYIVKRTTKNRATLLISQNLGEIHSTCTRMIILRRGTIVYDGTPIGVPAAKKFFRA